MSEGVQVLRQDHHKSTEAEEEEDKEVKGEGTEGHQENDHQS